jgi:hypothetical protein
LSSAGRPATAWVLWSRNQYLPGDIATGDWVSFNKAEASAECLFSRFHGINPPEVLYLDDDLVQDAVKKPSGTQVHSPVFSRKYSK